MRDLIYAAMQVCQTSTRQMFSKKCIGSYRELRKYGIDMNTLKQFISFYIYFQRQGFIFLDFLIQKVEHSQNRISESLIINCHGFSSTRLEKKLLLHRCFQELIDSLTNRKQRPYSWRQAIRTSVFDRQN